jgi:hypothetical protein
VLEMAICHVAFDDKLKVWVFSVGVGDLGHGCNLHISVLCLPPLIQFEQDSTDQADDGRFVWKDTDDIGAAFDLVCSAVPARAHPVDMAALPSGPMTPVMAPFMGVAYDRSDTLSGCGL